jgi:hypothetical protein
MAPCRPCLNRCAIDAACRELDESTALVPEAIRTLTR